MSLAEYGHASKEFRPSAPVSEEPIVHLEHAWRAAEEGFGLLLEAEDLLRKARPSRPEEVEAAASRTRSAYACCMHLVELMASTPLKGTAGVAVALRQIESAPDSVVGQFADAIRVWAERARTEHWPHSDHS